MKMLLWLSLFLSLSAHAYKTETDTSKEESSGSFKCSLFLNYSPYVEKKFSFDGKKGFTYYSQELNSESKNRKSGHNTQFIFPSLPQSKRLLVVIDGVHSYLQYNGYRIDSKGSVGRSVESFVRPAKAISGSLAFVIKELSEETKSQLEQLIRNNTPHKALTCTAVTCNILKEIGSEVASKHWFSSNLAKSLVIAHTQGKPVEIVSLNGLSPIDNLKNIEYQEQKIVPESLHYLGLAGGLAMAYSLVSFVF